MTQQEARTQSQPPPHTVHSSLEANSPPTAPPSRVWRSRGEQRSVLCVIPGKLLHLTEPVCSSVPHRVILRIKFTESASDGGTELQPGMMKKLGSRVVVTAARQCEYP